MTFHHAPPAPLASVVVPAFDAAATIRDCLAALGAQTLGRDRLEVIVVDDGSSDATAAIAAAAGATALRQPHSSPAVARNTGARAATAPVLLFTDADCAPDPTWAERMLAPFADPNVCGVKGVYRTDQRAVLPRFVQAELEEKYRRLARFESIDFVDTYAAAYRRDVFLASGGFDALFPAHSAEDVDLSFRLARQGCRLVFAPDARVRHRHADRLPAYLYG
ncbi:MAG: glycosyltransferase, partial [Chloroflexi bacterium]|nr:glycosyltransferase [Chloroflexota bacterium]